MAFCKTVYGHRLCFYVSIGHFRESMCHFITVRWLIDCVYLAVMGQAWFYRLFVSFLPARPQDVFVACPIDSIASAGLAISVLCASIGELFAGSRRYRNTHACKHTYTQTHRHTSALSYLHHTMWCAHVCVAKLHTPHKERGK